MPKLSDENNEAPMAGDFSMYYRGTYVAREAPNETQVMYVENVHAKGDDSKLKNILLTGYARTLAGEERNVTWPASDVLAYLPSCGFYKMSSGIKYVTFSTENRSQKKGLQANRVLFDGLRTDINLRGAYVLFNEKPFDGLFSKDLCLIKGELRWKQFSIGKLHDGALTIYKDYEYLQELVCKLLARCLEVKSTTIQ